MGITRRSMSAHFAAIEALSFLTRRLILILCTLGLLLVPAVGQAEDSDPFDPRRKAEVMDQVRLVLYKYSGTLFNQWISLGNQKIFNRRVYDSDISIYVDPAFLEREKVLAEYSDYRLDKDSLTWYWNDLFFKTEPRFEEPYIVWHEVMHALSDDSELLTHKAASQNDSDHYYIEWAEKIFRNGLPKLAKLEQIIKKYGKNLPPDAELQKAQNLWKGFLSDYNRAGRTPIPNKEEQKELKKTSGFFCDPETIIKGYLKLGYPAGYFAKPVKMIFFPTGSFVKTIHPGETVEIKVRIKDIFTKKAPKEGQVRFEYTMQGIQWDISTPQECPCPAIFSKKWTPKISDPTEERVFPVRVTYDYGYRKMPGSPFLSGKVRVLPWNRSLKLIFTEKGQPGKKVHDVKIRIKGLKNPNRTAPRGEVLIKDLKPSPSYTIDITAPGYEQRLIRVTLPAVKSRLEANKAKLLPVKLTRKIKASDLVTVPDLRGKTADTADSQLRILDLKLSSSQASTFNTAYALGIIIFQHPVPGSNVTSGSLVQVIVNPSPKISMGMKVKPDNRSYKPDTSLLFTADIQNLDSKSHYSFKWHVDGKLRGTGKSYRHKFIRSGQHYVQLALVSSTGAIIDAIIKNIHIEYPPDMEVLIGFSPESNEYKLGSTVGFSAKIKNAGRITQYRWYVDGKHVGNGRDGVIHTFNGAGKYEVKLGIRRGSNFDEVSETRILVVGDAAIGKLGNLRNRFEDSGAPGKLIIRSSYYRGGSREWSKPAFFNGSNIGAVKKYILYDGEQADGYNTGYLVYAPLGSRGLLFKVFHFVWADAAGRMPHGTVEYSGALPLHGKVPIAKSLHYTRKASRLSEVEWQAEDGSVCRVRISKFSKSNIIRFRGVDDLGCTKPAIDTRRLKQCKKFASRAVEQFDENLSRKCNYTSAEWHPDAEKHKKWCLVRSKKETDALTKQRDDALKSCGRTWCDSYARRAVEQNDENIRKQCRFTGRRWQSSYNNHFNWCRSKSKRSANSETGKRDRELRGCVSNRTGACKTYAEKAVRQSDQNIQKACGFCGPRWQFSFDSAFNWCLENPQSTRTQETTARNKLLGLCRTAIPGGVRTFYEPCASGYRLDVCLNFGTNCEKPAADQFCKDNGFTKATKWKRQKARPTYIIGDRKTCDADYCTGFEYITCSGYTNPNNRNPVCSIKRPKSGTVVRPGRRAGIGFSAKASDPDRDKLSYAWTFDGGRPDKYQSDWQSSVWKITWDKPGIYNATLTVTDGKGGICTDSIAVNVQDSVSSFDCDQYADISVNQNKQNLAKKCGFDDNLWHSNKSGHTNWCIQGNQGRAIEIITLRQKALDDCQPPKVDTSLTCDISTPPGLSFTDAGGSIDFTGAARSPAGGRLSYNWKFGEYGAVPATSTKKDPGKVTFKWAGSYKAVVTVTDHRGKTCKASRPVLVYDSNDPREFCEGYAGISVEQDVENKRNSCGFTGAHWHDNELNHQRWCSTISLNQAKTELKDRDDKLRMCKGGAGTGGTGSGGGAGNGGTGAGRTGSGGSAGNSGTGSGGKGSMSFGGIEFPLGNKSFADKVLNLNLGSGTGEIEGSAVIGPPDAGKGTGPSTVGAKGDVSLGNGGSITLKFTDNYLIDIEGIDLYVFEFGPGVEPFKVEISKDGSNWIDLGTVRGQPTGLDIHDKVAQGDKFSFVRLTDANPYAARNPKTVGTQVYAGADIDAVGAIGAVERPDLDGDNEPLTGALPSLEGEWELTATGGVIFKFKLRLKQSGNRFSGKMTHTNGSTPQTTVNGRVLPDGSVDFTRSTGNWRQHYTGKIVKQNGNRAIRLEGRFGWPGQKRKYKWNATRRQQTTTGNSWTDDPPVTGGGNPRTCAAYANLAMLQQHDNQRHKCGFVGARWHLDYNIHYSWCMRAAAARSAAETKARKDALALCNAQPVNVKATYLGCYVDKPDRDIKGLSFGNNQMTNPLCIDTCKAKGFRFAATQFSSQCFCGNSFGRYGEAANPDECKYSCKGDSKAMCGGYWRNSVYKTDAGTTDDPSGGGVNGGGKGSGTVGETNRLEPVADSHVYAYSYRNWNQSNLGKYNILGAGWHPTGGEKRTYLKFDLTGIPPASIGKATLRLYHYHTGGSNTLSLGVHKVNQAWREGNDTYHSGQNEKTAAPGEISWTSQPSFDPRAIARFNPGQGTNKYVEVDITPMVNAWLSGTPNNGLMIKAQGNLTRSTPQAQYGFYARETADADKRPVLLLTRSAMGGGLGGDVIDPDNQNGDTIFDTKQDSDDNLDNVRPESLTKKAAYARYIAAYNKLTALMSQGQGDTPAAQRAYGAYKKAKEAYEAIQ